MTVQGPVKEQQPDDVTQGGGGVTAAFVRLGQMVLGSRVQMCGLSFSQKLFTF